MEIVLPSASNKADGKILRLVDDHVVGGAHEIGLHLIRDRHDRAADHLRGECVNPVHSDPSSNRFKRSSHSNRSIRLAAPFADPFLFTGFPFVSRSPRYPLCSLFLLLTAGRSLLSDHPIRSR